MAILKVSALLCVLFALNIADDIVDNAKGTDIPPSQDDISDDILDSAKATDIPPSEEKSVEKRSLCNRSGWIKYGDRYYKGIKISKTWAAAERACVSMGGNLASVHDSQEYSAVQAVLRKTTGGNHNAWIGGHDAVQEGVWFWSDGSRFDYTNWYSGQPSNSGKRQHCLLMNYGGRWGDYYCTSRFYFVCAGE